MAGRYSFVGLLTRSVSASSPAIGRHAVAAANLGRAILPVAFGLWLGFVIVAGRPNLEPDVYGATVRLHVLFGALFAFYAGYLVLARKLPGPTPFDWPAAALIGAYALAVAMSVDARLSAEAAMQVLTCVVAFYVFAERRLVSLNTLVRSLVTIGLGVSLLTLLDVFGEYRQWLAAVEAIKGSVAAGDLAPPTLLRSRDVLDHPNNLAMFLNMALPLAAAFALIAPRRTDRLLGIAAVVLGCGALFLTLSRGAWLGTAMAIPVFWCAFHLLSGSEVSSRVFLAWVSRHSRTLLTGLGLACVGVACLAVALFALRPAWLLRDTLGTRFETTRVAMEIFLDHPLAGAGPHTYGLLSGAYEESAPGTLAIAHNAYLQTLSDLGVAGAAAVLIGGLVLLRILASAWRCPSQRDRVYLAACSAAVVATLVHGLSDSPASWNVSLLPFALILALAVRLTPQAPRVSGATLASVPRLAVLALVPLILAGWLFFDAAHSDYDRSIRSLTAGDELDAAAAAIDAAESDPDAFVYQLHAGVSLVNLVLDAKAPEASAEALGRGIAYLRRATEFDPHSSLAHANLALALQASNDPGGSTESARRALVASPEDPTIAVIAGSVFERAGLRDEAIEAYGAALEHDPALTQSPFWAHDAARLAMRDEAIAASGLAPCALGRFAALYGVIRQGLEPLASACEAAVMRGEPEARRSDLALILFGLGDGAAARGEAERALRDEGLGAAGLVMSAVVLSDADIRAARLDLLRAAYLGDADARALLGFTYTDGSLFTADLGVPVPRATGPMPDAVSGFLGRIVPADAQSVDESGQAYRAGRLHYMLNLLRQAPSEVLVHGEWSELVSPRILVALEAVSQP